MLSIKETLAVIDKIAKKYKINKPYLVGGIPRDMYLNKNDIKTSDLDLTTNHKDVLRLGILTAYELNVTFELAEDGHVTVYTDSFDIDFSSNFISPAVKEHLGMKNRETQEAFSRDFTINTLHMDLLNGEIKDPTGMAFEDIKNKIIKTPVPPEITLSDDPRRAYRAVNLAVRYGFDLDPELKKYIKDNPKLFSQENIKDRYISVKMIKALKIDAKRTIDLLKELNLFKNVPLVGFFKDILIQNKLLVEYLDENSGSDGWNPKASDDRIYNIKKLSNISSEKIYNAKNWDEYKDFGPKFNELANWWPLNFSNLGGKGPDYLSFVDWYWKNYNTKWGKKHLGPSKIMEKTKKVKSPKVESPKKLDFSSLDKNRKINDIDLNINSEYIVKPGVNISILDNNLKNFINQVGRTAKSMNLPKPIITSGYRSPNKQARVMYENWKQNGGKNGGLKYLLNLYKNDSVVYNIHNIFSSYNKLNAIKNASDYIEASRGAGVSRHLSGEAVDFSKTRGINEVLQIASKLYNNNIIINDEQDHIHVGLKKVRQPAAISNNETSIKPKNYNKDKVLNFVPKRFKPFSEDAISLFREAARVSGLPEEWSYSPGLHNILLKESGGWVGIPNYTYGKDRIDRNSWPKIHQDLKNNKISAKSSATGLGQLLVKNIDKFYPSGREGIGVPLEEAVGMLKYIDKRYKTPEEAWRQYNSKGFGY